MYRVLVVDDHDVVRRGIRSILEDRVSSIAISEAGSGDEALAALTEPFDAIVLDLTMPGRSGIDLLTEIKHRYPALPVLVMSLHSEAQFAVRALRAGAAGYLTKAAAPEQLVIAFEKIVKGGRYISEGVADRLAGEAGGVASAPHERLSDREFDVMRGIASGETVGESRRACTYRSELQDVVATFVRRERPTPRLTQVPLRRR